MLIVVAALLGLAGQTGVETKSDNPPVKPKKICRTLEANSGVSTGSMMGSTQICKTREDWAKIDAKKEKSS